MWTFATGGKNRTGGRVCEGGPLRYLRLPHHKMASYASLTTNRLKRDRLGGSGLRIRVGRQLWELWLLCAAANPEGSCGSGNAHRRRERLCAFLYECPPGGQSAGDFCYTMPCLAFGYSARSTVENTHTLNSKQTQIRCTAEIAGRVF